MLPTSTNHPFATPGQRVLCGSPPPPRSASFFSGGADLDPALGGVHLHVGLDQRIGANRVGASLRALEGDPFHRSLTVHHGRGGDSHVVGTGASIGEVSEFRPEPGGQTGFPPLGPRDRPTCDVCGWTRMDGAGLGTRPPGAVLATH